MNPLHPTDLGLILSYKCQSTCAHCIYNCSPHWKEWMTVNEVNTALANTLVWHHPYQIHITGGEPFLNFPLLLEAVKCAVNLKIPCYVETNAGWCVDRQLADNFFETLNRAGLAAVLISLSPFHAESIPLKRTMQTVLAAQEIFGIRNVLVYQYEWLKDMQHFGSDQTVPLEKYVEKYGEQKAGEMFWHRYGLIAGGRSGYRLGHLTDKLPVHSFKGQDCSYEIIYAQHSHFDLYGNIIPGFCGGISAGDWHDFPYVLSNFRERQYSPLIAMLVDAGPYALFEMAVYDFGYSPLDEGYAGKCHLCVDVRRHLTKTGDFPELNPKEFYERL